MKFSGISGSIRAMVLEQWSFVLFCAAIFSITFSIAAGETLLLLSIVIFIINVIKNRPKLHFPVTAVFALLFVIIAVASIFYGQNTAKGVGKLSRLFWFTTVPLAANLVVSRVRAESVLRSFLGGCVVLFVDVCIRKPVFEVFLQMGEGGDYENVRLADAIIDVGSMTDGQMVMLGVLVGLCLTMMARMRKEKTWIWILLLFLSGIALVVNCKRGSWFAGSAAVGIFVVWRFGWRWLVMMGLVVLSLLALPLVRERLSTLEKEFDPGKGGRAAMWLKVAPGLIRDYPMGYGYGSMTNEAMRKYAQNVEQGRKHLHNNFMQILVETGWHGLFLYVLWMSFVVYEGIKLSIDRGGAGADGRLIVGSLLLMVLALIMNGLVEYNFGDTELLIVLLALLGILGAAGRWIHGS